MDDDEKIIEMPPPVQSVLPPPGRCQCGCGGKTNKNARFILGHNVRVDAKMQAQIIGKGWKKGVSGNPGGRPKKKPITAAYEELMNERYPGDPQGRTGAELLAIAIFKEVIQNGNIGAAIEIANRVEGKTPEDRSLDGQTEISVSIYDRLKTLVDKLRSNPMASSGTPVGPRPDQPALPGGTGGVSGTPGDGV